MRKMSFVKPNTRTHHSRKGYQKLGVTHNCMFPNSQKTKMKLVFQEVCFGLVRLEFLGKVFEEKNKFTALEFRPLKTGYSLIYDFCNFYSGARLSKESAVLLRCQWSDKFLPGNNWSFTGLEYVRKPDCWSLISADNTQMLFKASDVIPWKHQVRRQEREGRVNRVRSTERRSGIVAKKKNEGRELWFGVVLKSLWAWDSSRIL